MILMYCQFKWQFTIFLVTLHQVSNTIIMIYEYILHIYKVDSWLLTNNTFQESFCSTILYMSYNTRLQIIPLNIFDWIKLNSVELNIFNLLSIFPTSIHYVSKSIQLLKLMSEWNEATEQKRKKQEKKTERQKKIERENCAQFDAYSIYIFTVLTSIMLGIRDIRNDEHFLSVVKFSLCFIQCITT